MRINSGRRLMFVAATALCALTFPPAAHAENFLSTLFGAFGGGRSQAPSIPLPFASEGSSYSGPSSDTRPRTGYSGGAQAYCVRTCDGRYFPISAGGNQSKDVK